MSLFGAARKSTTFQKAKERLDKAMAESSGTEHTDSSSGIGKQLEKMGRAEGTDPNGTAMTSEIAMEGREEEGQAVALDAVTLPREVYNRIIYDNNRKARESGHPSQVMEPVLGLAPCDKYRIRFSQMDRAQTISSDDSSELSSPPPITNYGGSEVQFPSQTPRSRRDTPRPSTNYEGSVLVFPPSALPMDPFSTPRASTGIIAQRYIQSEENTSQHAEQEGGMEETRKVYTPILRKFEISDDSDASDE